MLEPLALPVELPPEPLALPAKLTLELSDPSELLALAIRLLPGFVIILATLDAFMPEAMLVSPARVEAPDVMHDVLLAGHPAAAART